MNNSGVPLCFSDKCHHLVITIIDTIVTYKGKVEIEFDQWLIFLMNKILDIEKVDYTLWISITSHDHDLFLIERCNGNISAKPWVRVEF